jgi:hypothetical protein
LIEVSVHGKKPKKRFDFQWADDSYEMRWVSGKLTGLVRGSTGHPLQDLLHPVEIVHPAIPITLQDAVSSEQYQTTSDRNGIFLFDPVPTGIYILTIGGGAKSFSGQIADSTILVIDLTATADRDFLLLELEDGGCGGAEYQLQTER